MTPDAAATIRDRAQRQLGNGFCHCHVTADQVAELATGYLDALAQVRELADGYIDIDDRLERIAAIVPEALLAWCCNYRDKERAYWVEVGELARIEETDDGQAKTT